MTRTACLIRFAPVLLAAALATPCLAQDEDEKEVRARATWRPQAPELKELPPGVKPTREEFKIDRPRPQLPAFERPDSGVPESGAESGAESAPAADAPATEAVPVEPTDAAEEPASAPPEAEELQESTVASPEPPASVDVAATGAKRTMPRPVKGSVIQPDYPEDALLDGVEGYVTLEFTVTDAGRVASVAITEAQPEGVFERAVREAIQQWRFRPATENGEPVDQRVRHRFDFNID